MLRVTRALLTSALAAGVMSAQGPPPPGGGGPNFGPGLPAVPVPAQNPITPAKTVLGKMLFWEEQMSSTGTVACGTCHLPDAGGGDTREAAAPGADGIFGTADDTVGSPGVRHFDDSDNYDPHSAFGFNVQTTGRATPTMIAAAYFPEMFWDGRAGQDFFDPDTGALLIRGRGALENQAIGPIRSDAEMAHENRQFADVTNKLEVVRPMALATNLPADIQTALTANPTYPDLFAAAFGDANITAARIAMAIATYERTLIPDQTPLDAFLAGNQNALTAAQARGMNTFFGPGRCDICHTGQLFSDRSFRNIGLRPSAEDPGRQDVTGNPADRGRFKVPTLRNVGLRSHWMHNGQFQSLNQVVDFYARGGDFADNRDPAIIPLNLGAGQRADLVNFLTSALTDSRVANRQSPFDRPTLHSETVPAGGDLYGGFTWGTGFRIPLMLADNPATLPNPEFKIGMYGGLGGAPAFLGIALNQAAPGGLVQGAALNIELTGSTAIVPSLLDGVGAGEGYTTVGLAIPNATALRGTTLFTQWFVYDNGAVGGVTSTQGARLTLH